MNFPSPSSADAVIGLTNITCHFGTKRALNDVSLYVPRGAVFGLVGENGAGKTTLIKHILGLRVPQSGRVRVLGMDPTRQAVAVLARLGYLSEQRDLPGWMRVGELIRYTRAFHPKWDAAYADQLRREFDLDPDARVRTLSQGMLAKAGLLLALAHRPELLVLDEPSSGLDPVVRRDILEAIIRTVGEEGRTVFFSSHLLDEIERVCDHVAILHQGAVSLHGPLDLLKATHRELILDFEEHQPGAPAWPGALRITGQGRHWQVLTGNEELDLSGQAQRLGARIVEERHPSLDDIFVARVTKPVESAP